MDTLWIVLLSAATPIAGIVGFAIQLRTVKKTRLENEKLSLEIQKLKADKEISERKLILPTTQEVIDYNSARYSRGEVRAIDDVSQKNSVSQRASFSEKVLLLLIVTLAVLFFSYLVFDLYRFYTWLRSYVNF